MLKGTHDMCIRAHDDMLQYVKQQAYIPKLSEEH